MFTVPGLYQPPFIKVADHQPAYTYLEENNDDFLILSGFSNHVQTNGVNIAKIISDYNRNVILVKDDEPYLIDINQVKNKGDLIGSNTLYHERFRTFTGTNEIYEFTMHYNLPQNFSASTNSITDFSINGSNSITATQLSNHYFSGTKNLSYSIGKNFSNGTMLHQGGTHSNVIHNVDSIKEISSKEAVSNYYLIGENAVAKSNLQNHGYSTQSLANAREI